MRPVIAACLAALAGAGCPQAKQNDPPPTPPVTPLESFEKRFGPIWVDLAYAVAQARDGGFIMAGASEKVDDRYKGDYDALLVHADAAGERNWSQSFGEVDADDKAADVVVLDDGFLVAGTVSVRASDGGQPDKQAWLFRVDGRGKLLWEARVGAADKDDGFTSLAVTPRGGVYAAGASNADLVLYAFDLKGKQLW